MDILYKKILCKIIKNDKKCIESMINNGLIHSIISSLDVFKNDIKICSNIIAYDYNQIDYIITYLIENHVVNEEILSLVTECIIKKYNRINDFLLSIHKNNTENYMMFIIKHSPFYFNFFCNISENVDELLEYRTKENFCILSKICFRDDTMLLNLIIDKINVNNVNKYIQNVNIYGSHLLMYFVYVKDIKFINFFIDNADKSILKNMLIKKNYQKSEILNNINVDNDKFPLVPFDSGSNIFHYLCIRNNYEYAKIVIDIINDNNIVIDMILSENNMSYNCLYYGKTNSKLKIYLLSFLPDNVRKTHAYRLCIDGAITAPIYYLYYEKINNINKILKKLSIKHTRFINLL